MFQASMSSLFGHAIPIIEEGCRYSNHVTATLYFASFTACLVEQVLFPYQSPNRGPEQVLFPYQSPKKRIWEWWELDMRAQCGEVTMSRPSSVRRLNYRNKLAAM